MNCKFQETLTNQEIPEKIKEIYLELQDETSKKLFEARLSMMCNKENYTHLLPYASDACREHMASKKVWQIAHSFLDPRFRESKYIVYYGIGFDSTAVMRSEIGHGNIARYQENGSKILFCDQKSMETPEFMGFPVISPKELVEEYQEAHVAVLSSKYEEEIMDFLLAKGFPKENIFHRWGFYDNDGQYFDPEIIKLTEEEVFVDAGALRGETSVLFRKKVEGRYKKIYLFEPNEHSRVEMDEKFGKEEMKNYQVFPFGLWHQKETLLFGGSNFGGFGVGHGEKNIKVEVDSLDHLLGDEKVTFLKMDIEGAELNALKGASSIIKKYKPKLAISIYHKPEDILEIPSYIKALVPEYKLYLRHYSTNQNETLLYAVI